MAVSQFYSFFAFGNAFTTDTFLGNNNTPELVALNAEQFAMTANNAGSTDLEFYGGTLSETTGSVLDIPGTGAAMAALDTGNYVVAKQEGAAGISFAVYNPAGTSIVANTSLADTGSTNAAVSALGVGGFAIVYEDVFAVVNGDIEISLRDVAGASTGSVIVDATAANDRNPSIATLTSGNIAVAWQRVVAGATELWYAIYTAAGGLVLSPALLDNTGTINRDASVVAPDDGGFAIVYEDNEYGGDLDIAIARVDAAGAAQYRDNVTNNATEDRNPDAVLVTGNMVAISVTVDDGVSSGISLYQYNPLIDFAEHEIDVASAGGDDSSIASAFGNGTIGVAFDFAATSTVDAAKFIVRRTSLGDAADDTAIGDGIADTMLGQDGADTLNGGGGDDILDGGFGEDAMTGGTGNDIFHVDETYDATIEALDEGIDLVNSTITHALRVNIEKLTLQGSANINGTGNSLDNTIIGTSGNNILNGLAGADTMRGGLGNDTYYFDNAGDTVFENAGEGIDIVRSSVSAGLGLEIEKLYLTGSATNGTGNTLSNFIYGNALANTINGSDGADRLFGYEGDDIYFADSSGDLVFETIAGAAGGTDEVRSTVNHTLATNVENLLLTLSDDVNGTGNSLANTITGNGGNNYLYGREGNDTLTGNSGIDQFVFDRAIGPLNVDTITDFNVTNDFLRLDDAIFTALATGYLAAADFVTGTAAADATDRVIYNSATGAVFYDSDGTGAAAQVQFATLTNLPVLAAGDVFVF